MIRFFKSIIKFFSTLLSGLSGLITNKNKKMLRNKHVIEEKINSIIEKKEKELKEYVELAGENIKILTEKEQDCKNLQIEIDKLLTLKEYSLNEAKKVANELLAKNQVPNQNDEYIQYKENYIKVENSLKEKEESLSKVKLLVKDYSERRAKYKAGSISKRQEIEDLKTKKTSLKNELQNAIEERRIYEMESGITSSSYDEDLKELESTIKSYTAEASALKDISDDANSSAVLYSKMVESSVNNSIGSQFDSLILDKPSEVVYPLLIPATENGLLLENKKENN
mgnify:CR=1 FL=1